MGTEGPVDPTTSTFRRLLSEAGAGERARVDALIVFAQRTVFAATWPGQQAVRTLTNRDGETAMPVFSGRDTLDETATRFGWRGPDGSLSFRELSASEALQQALARGVHFVVVDIGSDHAVEFAREELGSLSSLQMQRGAAGAFAAAGEPEAAILSAVRRSSRPPAPGDLFERPASKVSAAEIDMPFAELKAAKAAPVRALSQPLAAAAQAQRAPAQHAAAGAAARALSQAMPTHGASQQAMPAARPQPMAAMRPPSVRPASVRPPSVRPPSVRPQALWAHAAAAPLEAPNTTPQLDGDNAAPDPEERESGEQVRSVDDVLPEALLQAIRNGLRAFPEVEWACVLPEEAGAPVVGVRVDPSFLNRAADITDAIAEAGDRHQQPLSMLLLNTPDLVKSARKQGKAFYPWKG